jgi:broad specificity phosphatase PhoE
MLLVCVRHLPTSWNEKLLLQGQRDIPLIKPDEETLEQVRLSRRKLSELGPFDSVWTSTLERAQHTARLYGYDELVIDPLLDELSFGPFEGRHRDELNAAHGEEWMKDPRGLVLGESLQALHERINAFLEKCSGDRKVLVFGHGSWMRALRSIMENGDVRAMNQRWVANNEILQFEVQPAGYSSGIS